MQSFEWQYHNEKILFKKHENSAAFIFRIFPKILIILILGSLFSSLTYYISKNLIYSLIPAGFFIVILIIYLLFIIKFHKETFFAFTDKRVVKSVRNWLFSQHIKELKIENVKQTTATSMWIAGKIFGYGNINVQWHDKETSLYFRNIWENKAIVLYISRMIDFIKTQWDKAELRKFKSNFSKK